MLNVDKYRKEILNGDLEELECRIATLRCHKEKCTGNECSKCVENTIYWLFSEYEESLLLKNDDNLKPGDWIMVRDSEFFSWEKKRFVCYYKGFFYTTDEYFFPNNTNITAWAQARLPKDDE